MCFSICNLNALRITDTPARCAMFSSISQRPSPLFRSQSEKSILTLVTGAERCQVLGKAEPGQDSLTSPKPELSRYLPWTSLSTYGPWDSHIL